MFQFPTFPFLYYFTHIRISSLFLLDEFPHSDIHGLQNICFSPWLFAAYHVLLRLLVPRHSPYALSSLTYFFSVNHCFSFFLLKFFSSSSSLPSFHISIYFSMCFLNLLLRFGGLKWNRTIDLTLIRRAL